MCVYSFNAEWILGSFHNRLQVLTPLNRDGCCMCVCVCSLILLNVLCVDCTIGGGSGVCTVWTAPSVVGVVNALCGLHHRWWEW